MFSRVSPGHVELDGAEFMPEFLLPLVTALEQGQDAGPVITAIVQRLGFENFLYCASVSPRLSQENRSYVFTTLPREWVVRYDQEAYIEVDPRFGPALDSALPFVWDYCTEYGRSPRVNKFLDESLAHGVGSGVVLGFRGAKSVRVIVALSNPSPRTDAAQRQIIADNLGAIVLFATHFHEIFMKAVIEPGIAPASQGAPLSPRELECLSFAARGLTTSDMPFKLGMSERTIQFHFDSIRSKLGAANLQEAIAKAISEGLIAM